MHVAAVTMETGLLIFCACADNYVALLLSIKWVDQGVVIYSIISYLACLWNQRCPDNRG